MKRAGAILSLIVIIVILSTSLCFGGTLKMVDSYPKDGSKGASIENLGLKLYFETDMTAEKVGKINENVFQLYDPEGKKLPTRVLYPPKEDGVVLVLLDNTKDSNGDGKADVTAVAGNSEYKLTISKDLTDNDGNTLGADKTITFTTINQNANMMINMGMMVVMFGGMFLFTSKSAKKAAEKEKKDEKVNPYKEAKKTGKSVEEIVAKEQRAKARREAKEAARQAGETYVADEDDYDDDVHRVKGPRPIAAAGGTYTTGRKAIAEAKAAEAAKRAAYAQNVKKGKGKKKK